MQVFHFVAFIWAASLLQPVLYLDPGSGSFILQLLLGVVVGLLVALKAYWGRLRGFFTRDDKLSAELEARDQDSDSTS